MSTAAEYDEICKAKTKEKKKHFKGEILIWTLLLTHFDILYITLNSQIIIKSNIDF